MGSSYRDQVEQNMRIHILHLFAIVCYTKREHFAKSISENYKHCKYKKSRDTFRVDLNSQAKLVLCSSD